MRFSTIWLGVVLLAAAAGCGKRDDPTPPVPVIPQATSDLVVAQRGDQLILAWSYPALSTAGRNLPGIDAIEVRRLIETLPPGEPPADEVPVASEPGTPWERVAFSGVPEPSATRFGRDSEVIATLERDRIPAAVAGARVLYVDEPSLRADDGRPLRISYSVRTRTGDAWSDAGNVVRIVPLELSGPPQNLRASAGAAGVELTWERPADADSHPPIGYFIYRFSESGDSADAAKPVSEAPVSDTSYTDAPAYGTWKYAVTAVRDAGPPAVESAPTNVVTVEFRDLQPPPQPPEVLTLLEDPAVRIVWTGVEAPDLAGYHVYRIREGREAARLTSSPQKDLVFRDSNPPRGATYTYAVSSVDSSGNESGRTAAAPVIIPPG